MPLAGADVELDVHGPALNDEERAHRAELEQLVAELGLEGRVTIGDAVPRSEIPALLAAHDALVNNMRAGAPDKVVYEAAAACRPVLASNPIFDELLDPEQRFAALGSERARRADPRARRDEHGRAGRARPAAARARRGGHSVQSWARGILDAAGMLVTTASCSTPRRSRGSPARRRTSSSCLPTCASGAGTSASSCSTRTSRARGSSPRALRERGVPLDDDPAAGGRRPDRVRRGRRLPRPRTGPASCTRISSTPTSTASSPGSVARVPLRLSTKHGFNEFREGRWFGFADRSVGSLAHVHIAISQGLAQYLAETEGFDEEDFEIVHYGISADGERDAYAGAAPRLLCIGRLIPIKGHSSCSARSRRPARSVPDVALDVAGRGPLEPALKAYARELGVDRRRPLPRLRRRRSRRAIEDAAVVVVPSLGEGFGMVALEAMERARPVIASAVGGLPEIVASGETGLVVPLGGRRGARRGDRRARGRPSARGDAMGAAGARARSAEFTPERCVERVGGALRARARTRADVVPVAPPLHALPGRREREGGEEREEEVPRCPVREPFRRRPSRRACCRRA